jgi:replicative DNA helicase
MKLSAPVYRLKRKAKLLSREESIPLHDALDRVAAQEGFTGWSLLASMLSEAAPARKLFGRLTPGDLVLVGARPGQGKTLLCLELAVEAMRAGNRAAFFTLEYTEKDLLDRFRDIEVHAAKFNGQFQLDCSDAVSAGYIMEALVGAPPGTFVVIDYLQLLDQKRENPELSVQIRALKSFAQDRGMIIACISQIDRSYDPATKPCPDTSDVRLPNPLDLKLFNKTCFLHGGEVRFTSHSV